MVRLVEITADSLSSILKLKVASNQEKFVANNAISIAQAHFHPETAWFRGIYDDETPVGFVMLSLEIPKNEFWIWRLMVAEGFQGKGYGKAAVQAVKDFVHQTYHPPVLYVSIVPEEGSPQGFYEKLGFEDTGRMEEGEVILEYKY